MDDTALAERASHYHQLVLDVAYGPGGMIHDFPLFDTRRPFQEGESVTDMLGSDWTSWAYGHAWPEDAWYPTVAEMWYGENTLWVTGFFLSSQLIRHRVTGDEEAARSARKCYLDLNHYFDLSAESGPGLLAKPHGGRPGRTWSFDQSACPVVFYAEYAERLASAEERELAARNLRAHGRMYLERDWAIIFAGRDLATGTSQPSAMKVYAAGHAAAVISGDDEVRESAAERVLEVTRSSAFPWPPARYTTNHNLYYWALVCDYWRRTELADSYDWKGAIEEYWHAAKLALEHGDGLPLNGFYDPRARSFEPHPHGWQTETTVPEARAHGVFMPDDLVERWWSSDTSYVMRPFNAVSMAALGLLAQSLGLDHRAHAHSRRILERVEEDLLRWWWDDGRLPDELKPLTAFFSTETTAVWQLAYWLGREQRAW
jgi:hypothetical protein